MASLLLTLSRNLRAFLGSHGRRILTGALVLVTFTILGFVIVRDWDTLRQFRWHLRPSLLALAWCCHAVSLAGTFVVWKLIMSDLGSPVEAGTDFHIYFLSLAARKIPSAIWYAGTRFFLYRQKGVSGSLVLTAVALEFGIAVLTGGWVFVAFRSSYLFMEHYEWVEYGVLALTLVLTGLYLVQPDLPVRWARRGKEGGNHPIVVLNRSRFLTCCVIYLVSWVVGGTSFYLTIEALIPNQGIDWVNAVGVATLSTLVVLAGTVLPTGIGLKELAAGVLLGAWLPVPVGLSVAVAYRILQLADEALWVGAAYFFRSEKPERVR